MGIISSFLKRRLRIKAERFDELLRFDDGAVRHGSGGVKK